MTEEPSANSSNRLKYNRIVLKISGEALGCPATGETIDGKILETTCRQIKAVHDLGAQIGVVVGGGNIFRGSIGAAVRGVDRTTGDHMGMLATVINGLALMDCLEGMGVDVRVQSAIPMEKFCESFIMRRAQRHLEKRRVLVFVAGTGNPYFSTDTTAALRASEIKADVIFKATKVDGVYDKDPNRFQNAVRYQNVSFDDALHNDLRVMDATAFALCRESRIPIFVFNMTEDDGLIKAALGQGIGTLVAAAG